MGFIELLLDTGVKQVRKDLSLPAAIFSGEAVPGYERSFMTALTPPPSNILCSELALKYENGTSSTRHSRPPVHRAGIPPDLSIECKGAGISTPGSKLPRSDV